MRARMPCARRPARSAGREEICVNISCRARTPVHGCECAQSSAHSAAGSPSARAPPAGTCSPCARSRVGYARRPSAARARPGRPGPVPSSAPELGCRQRARASRASISAPGSWSAPARRAGALSAGPPRAGAPRAARGGGARAARTVSSCSICSCRNAQSRSSVFSLPSACARGLGLPTLPYTCSTYSTPAARPARQKARAARATLRARPGKALAQPRAPLQARTFMSLARFSSSSARASAASCCSACAGPGAERAHAAALGGRQYQAPPFA